VFVDTVNPKYDLAHTKKTLLQAKEEVVPLLTRKPRKNSLVSASSPKFAFTESESESESEASSGPALVNGHLP
jgi:hypothetical protein